MAEIGATTRETSSAVSQVMAGDRGSGIIAYRASMGRNNVKHQVNVASATCASMRLARTAVKPPCPAASTLHCAESLHGPIEHLKSDINILEKHLTAALLCCVEHCYYRPCNLAHAPCITAAGTAA